MVTVDKTLLPIHQNTKDYLLWHFLRPAEFFLIADHDEIQDNMKWIRNDRFGVWKSVARLVGRNIGTDEDIHPSSEVVRIMKKFGYDIKRRK